MAQFGRGFPVDGTGIRATEGFHFEPLIEKCHHAQRFHAGEFAQRGFALSHHLQQGL